MKIRIKKYRRRRRKRGRDILYVYNNKVYLGKKQKGSGTVSQVLANLIQRVGDIAGV